MSKSLQKCILFAVCIALVCALGVTLFIFDGTGGAVTGQEGQASGVADAAANAYEHGGNIGRTASGEQVTDASGFMTALRSNKTINLQKNITLSSSDAFPRSADGYVLSYSSTIYGNGHTISFTGRHSEGSGEWANPTNSSGAVFDWKQTVNYYGGIVGQLAEGGHIYDLNVVMTSGNIAFKSNDEDSGDTWLDVGGIAGIVESGASIENCTFTISQENSRLASLKWPETTWLEPANQWGRAGGIAGELNGGSIINCTVTNNGSIEAGDSGQYDYVTGATYRSAVGNIVGWIGSGTIQNVRVSGSGSLNAFKVGNIGVLKSGSTISTQNFYNNFSGTFNVLNSTNGGSSSSAYDAQNGSKSATITNMFTENNATSGSVTGTVNTINNTSNIPSSRNYSVYFDPNVNDTANSLAVAFNQAPVASYKYTLVSGNRTTYENPETTSNAIVFRKLPTDATIWNSGGNFTAVLESEFAGPQHRQPDLQPYEHGYTTGTPSGTAINDGSQFEGLFSRTGTIEAGDTGTYYLKDDIVITGFTGKQFAGTLDGNGHTIYIAASDTALSGAGDATTGFAVGGLVGVLTGTIKNVRVVIDADITVGLDSNKKGRIGGVVGRLNGGTLDNVQVVIPSDVTISHNTTGDNDSGMGGVVGQALGASSIQNVTVQMDGTLAPVGTWTFVSALVAEVPTKNGTPTIDMDNIIVRGAGTFAAEATRGGTAEPPYVSALANFNNQKGNEIVNLNGLIYDFKPTISGGGASAYGIFVNNWSDGNPNNYGAYVTTSNMFQMFGKEYTAVANGGTEAGNAPVPLDGELKTINTSVTGVGGATVAAYFMPGTGLVRLQVHSDSWGDERLTISGVEVDDKPIMSSLTTAGDSSSDRYFSVDKSTLSGLNSVQVSLFSNVTDPTVQALTYTGSPLDIVIDMDYNGAPLTAGDYSLSNLTASGGNALVQDGKPLNAGEYSVTVTLNNPDHWFGISGSGEASKTANVTFTVSPKNVTMQAPDSMTAVYGEKYWIQSENNVWGLDENLFFDEVVGNVEYTATVTRTDDGEGYASASGWLKAGSYIVALTINDSNYAINGNASVTYPLTITPVELSYTLTVENSVAAVYDGNVRTISGTPQGGDGIISAALEGSAGTAGDSVTAAVSVTYGGVAAQIQNAGDYVLGVALSGDDAENYTAVLTASWAEGGAIENNTVTVEKRSLDLQWSFDSNVALEYGDVITDELIAETQLSDAIPYNGGSYTGSISFTITSATYNGGTAYAPGVAAGTYVTFEVAPVLPDELDENNYTISLSAAGGETKTVEERTLTVDYDAFAMTAAYGDSISNEWLTEQYKEQIAQSITNIYNNEDVTFKIVLHSRNSGGGYTEINDFADLEMGITYMAAVVVDGNSNYTIPNSLSNGYDFTLTARALTISGITWEEEGFDGVYDGKEHALKAVLAEGSSIKEGDEGVLELSKTSLTAVNDGGMITVTVASAFADKYTLTGTTSFNVTLDQKPLTISPFTADFLDYGLTELYEYLISADSGLVTGAAEGDTLAISGSWAASPAEAELGGEKYVAAGNYTLNISVTDSNYKFDDNAMSVTVKALDISGAEVAVTWNESNLTYTAQEQSVTLASVTVNGVDMPVEWFNLTGNAGTDAKTYTANIAANNANITGSATAEFTIAPAPVTVKWEVTGDISVGKVMPETATDISSLGLTGKVVEFTAPGITDSAQYSIVVAASGFDAGHSFAAGDEVTLTPSMTFAEGVKAGNYQITYDPETIVKTVTATPVEVKPVNADYSATYGSSVTSAEAFISATYFTIMSGAEGVALTADNFTVTVTNAEGEEQTFGAHGLDAGTYTVTIEGKGVYYVSNDDNRFTYTITPLTLTAGDWSGIDDLTYNGIAADPVFIPAGVLDGDSVTPDVTVTGDKVTSGQAVNAGAYTATAESDNVNYKFDGVANVKEFTIAQMVLSGDWEVDSDMDMTYDGTDKSAYVTWTWTVAPLNDGDVTFEITFNGEKTAVNAGNYTATVTFTDSTGNYDTQSGILQGNKYDSMTIKPRPVEITWTAPADLTYSAEAKVPTATISKKVGTDEVTATITYNGNNTDVTAEGFTATVTELTGAAKDNYTLEGGTGITSEKYTITALDVPYEWSFADSAAITYGDGEDKVKALVTLPDGTLLGTEEKVTFEVSVDYSGTTSAGSTVTFTVTAKLPEGVNEANYNITVTAKDGNNTLTVDKAQITFTGNAVTEQKIAGGTLTLTAEQLLAGKYYTIAPAPDSTYSVSGKLSVTRVENSSGQEITADANGYTFTEEGEYTVTYAVSSEESDNYAPAAETFTATLTVSEDAISLTPTWDEYTFTYNGTAQYPVPTFNQTPDEGAIVYTVTARGDSALTDNSAVNAGDYTVTISVAEGFEQKYEFAEDATLTFDFTIGRLEAKLSWSEEDATYDGQAHILTATVSNKAAGDDVTVQVELTDGDNTNVTEQGYYFTATGLTGAAAGNYKLPAEVRSGKFYIKPAELTVTTANTSFTYDGSVKGIDRLGVSLSGAVAGDDVSAVIDSVVSGGESAELKNAGSYTVTYRLEGAAAGNYKIIAGGSVGVTIGAKALTFTWNSDQTFTYNGAAQVPGYTLDGVVGGDEVTVTVTVTGGNETEGQAINAGVYTASVAEITKGNYSLTGVQTCSFTIGKANLTLTPDSVKFSDRDAEKLSAYSKTNYVATIKTDVTVTGVGSDGVFNDFTVTTDASFTGENDTLTVGNYTFTVSVAGGNYNDATYTVNVTAQAVAAFTATPSSTTYTGGEITFSFANKEGIQLEEGVQITVSGITFNNASADSVLNAGSYIVTFAVTGNSADNNYWYTVSSWSGNISPATVTANAVTAVYGDVYTALETGGNLQNGGVWQFVTFNGSPVEVTVTVTDAIARAGETYLGAGTYDVTVTLVSGNFTFAGGNSVASTLQITPKQLNIAAQPPEDLTYTSEGIVIGLEDYASQLVGDDKVTVSMLVDGKPYVAGVTVLGAGEHTVTVTMTDASGNYQLAAAQQTFTVEKKEVTSSITVSGETIENNSSLEIVHGENARVQNAIDNYLTQNGVEEGEYTLTVTNSAGQAADLDNISAWAPGTYTVNLGLSDNFEGGMTFTIVVQEGTTAQIPDAPVLPSTPLEDGGSSGVANWLFPLIIAIECLIAIALIVAIAVSAARRSKNS